MNPPNPLKRLSTNCLHPSARSLGRVWACLGLGLGLGLGPLSLAQDPPKIANEPQDCVVSLGGDGSFQVRASASAPAWVEWYYTDGTTDTLLLRSDNHPRTGVTLTVPNVQAAAPGGYYAVITNEWGSVTSRIAHLTVDRTFIQITGQPIVEDSEASSSAVWFDYDGDGRVDVFVANHNHPVIRSESLGSLYRNLGDGTFSRVTDSPLTELGGVYPIVWADFNNDGRTDAFLAESLHGGGYRGRVFVNQGDGLYNTHPQNLGAAFCAAARDIDGDGWVDLVLFTGYTRVYRNLGDGRFIALAASELPGLGNARAISGGFADFDNDGHPDLHLATETDPGTLYRNLGGFAFDQIRAGSLPGTANIIGLAWADYDNDGYFDLLTVSSAWGGGAAPRLHRNISHPTDPSQRVFEDVSAAAGLLELAGSTFGPAWGDFNNDGYLDLFLARSGHLGSASTNTLLLNQGDGTFVPINVGSPLHASGSFAAVWGDYDNDGFLDLLLPCVDPSLQRSPNLLFRNNLPDAGNQNRWLKVQLDGRAANRSGIGAVLRLRATIDGREMWQTRQIASNGNTWGQGPELLAHFGLGDAAKVDLLRIEWPSGIVQELTDLEPNQMLTVVETQNAPTTQLPQVTDVSTADGLRLVVECPTEPMSGVRCVLEASNDLVRWTKVQVRVNETGTMEFSDPHAADHPSRFYRVVVP